MVNHERHPHKKLCTAHKCFFDDLRFSCNQSNQVAARRSSRSQNSRPQRAVDRPSCNATAVCRDTAWMMRLPGGLHYRNFRNKMTNDKLTSQKPEGDTYFRKKTEEWSKSYIHKQFFKQKTMCFPPHHCLLGFPQPASEDSWSAASGLANSARSCKAVASPGESRCPVPCLGDVSGDFNIDPTQLCRINPGWRDYFSPYQAIPGDQFGDVRRFFGDNSYIPVGSFINPRFFKDPYHFIPQFSQTQDFIPSDMRIL